MPTNGFIIESYSLFYDTFVARQDYFNTPIFNLVKMFTGFVGFYLTCWIMYRGYQILWGKNQDNIKDFMWDAFIRFIFIALCFYPEGWLTLISNGLKEFHELRIGNSENFIYLIQEYWNKSASIVRRMMGDGKWYEMIYVVFMVIVVMIGTFVGCIFGFRSYILNYIGFVFLLALLPFALLSLVFGNFLKDTFKNWWGLMLSSCLTLIFLNAFAIGIFAYANEIYFKEANRLLNENTNFYLIALMAVFTGTMIAAFTKIIISLVEKIVGTSIEGVSGSAMLGAAGTMGAVGGGAALGARLGTKWSFSGVKLGWNSATKGFQNSKKLMNFIKRKRGITQ